MNIHALTVDRGGCFHYRIRQPLKHLRRLGHWTSWGSGIDIETWERADVLIQQYLHYPSTCETWLRWCANSGKLCVSELDDDIFTVHEHPAHGSAYDDPETLPRMIRMIEASHLVTVTTPALAEVYRPYNPRVAVLPNAVDDDLFTLPPAPENGRQLVLGYTGSPSHLRDYEAWSPVLARWMRRRLGSTLLRYYGADYRPVGLPRSWPVDVHPWQRQTMSYLASLRMDVGVAPLLDTTFNRGKSPIKALEYAALGIPAVVADHPVYSGGVIVPGVTGFLAADLTDWIEALSLLWDDPGRRKAIGAAARLHALSHRASLASVERERVYQEGLEWLK